MIKVKSDGGWRKKSGPHRKKVKLRWLIRKLIQQRHLNAWRISHPSFSPASTPSRVGHSTPLTQPLYCTITSCRRPRPPPAKTTSVKGPPWTPRWIYQALTASLWQSSSSHANTFRTSLSTARLCTGSSWCMRSPSWLPDD